MFPLARWLRGELRPLAERLLADEHLDAAGHLPARARDALSASRISTGARDESERLWPLLMFQLWHLLYVEEELDGGAGVRVAGGGRLSEPAYEPHDVVWTEEKVGRVWGYYVREPVLSGPVLQRPFGGRDRQARRARGRASRQALARLRLRAG